MIGESSPNSRTGAGPARVSHPTFREALWVWVKIGLLSFGGPAGQIALMHRELVERRRWVSDSRFLHALNYCMLLPGPEAQQLAIYIGWLLHRAWGGLVAGCLFVLPGALLLWGISYVYVRHGQVPAIEAVFYGLKAAVMAIVAAAVIRIGKKALKNPVMWTVSALAFVAIRFVEVPFPIIVIGAGLVGLVGGRLYPAKFDITLGHAAPGQLDDSVIQDAVSSATIPLPTWIARCALPWAGWRYGSCQSWWCCSGWGRGTLCSTKVFFSVKRLSLPLAARMPFSLTWLNRPSNTTVG